jgi:G6PDH family F420-dependent oxidoreductase
MVGVLGDQNLGDQRLSRDPSLDDPPVLELGPRRSRTSGTHIGAHYTVDHAQLYDLPEKPIPVIVGVSGPRSIELARAKADGIMATEPKPKLVKGFHKGDKRGPAYSEVALAYAPSVDQGRKLAHERFRFAALGWAVNSELPSVDGFEAATRFITPDALAKDIPAGPDPDVHIKAIRKHIDAGFDHLVLVGSATTKQGLPGSSSMS